MIQWFSIFILFLKIVYAMWDYALNKSYSYLKKISVHNAQKALLPQRISIMSHHGNFRAKLLFVREVKKLASCNYYSLEVMVKILG